MEYFTYVVEKVPFHRFTIHYPHSVGKEGKRVPQHNEQRRKKLALVVVITTMRQLRSNTLSREISFQFIEILKDDVTLE